MSLGEAAESSLRGCPVPAMSERSYFSIELKSRHLANTDYFVNRVGSPIYLFGFALAA